MTSHIHTDVHHSIPRQHHVTSVSRVSPSTARAERRAASLVRETASKTDEPIHSRFAPQRFFSSLVFDTVATPHLSAGHFLVAYRELKGNGMWRAVKLAPAGAGRWATRPTGSASNGPTAPDTQADAAAPWTASREPPPRRAWAARRREWVQLQQPGPSPYRRRPSACPPRCSRRPPLREPRAWPTRPVPRVGSRRHADQSSVCGWVHGCLVRGVGGAPDFGRAPGQYRAP